MPDRTDDCDVASIGGAKRALKRNEKSGVVAAAVMTSALIGLSRVTGVVRDIGRTSLFGRDWRTDAYVCAFSLPDLVYLLASGGALSSGFIPVFSGYLAAGEDERAIKTFRVLMTYIAILIAAVIFACELLAPRLVILLFPGMVEHHDKLRLTVLLVRIILPAQFFFALGALFSGALMSLRCFAEPPLQSVLYNIGILMGGIVGAHFCSHWLGGGVEGMAIGALIGAAIGAVGIQWLRLRQLGMSFSPCFDWRDEGAREVMRLILPVMASLSVTYINSTILPRSFSSVLSQGAATSVEMANRVIQLPVALFGASIGIALFPTLSTLAATEALDELRKQIAAGVRAILLFAVPSAVLIGVLRVQVIALLFQYGRWTAYDTQVTGTALLFYSIGVPAMACQYVLARGFYAMRDTRTPVMIALGSFALAMLANLLLVRTRLEHGGLALASSVAAWFYMLMLMMMLNRRINGFLDVEMARSFAWFAIGSVVTGVFAHAVLRIISMWVSANLYGRFACVFIPALIGAFAFALTLWLAGFKEVGLVARRFASIIRLR